jgi:hypothetical protein
MQGARALPGRRQPDRLKPIETNSNPDGRSAMSSLDSFKCRKSMKVGGKTYHYYSLAAAEKNGLKGLSKLPFSLKVLIENLKGL